MRLAVVLPCFELMGEERGQAMTYDTFDILDKIARDTDNEFNFLFVVDRFAEPNKLSMATLREARPTLISAINSITPDAVLCLGKQAAAALFDNGSVTIESLRRKVLDCPDVAAPVYVSFSLEQVYYKRGYADWIARDLQACMDGYTQVAVPDYIVSTEVPPHWENGLPPRQHAEARNRLVGFDLETYPGLSPWVDNARIRMGIVTDVTGYTQIIPADPATSAFPDWLCDMLAHQDVCKWGSNIKFDSNWLTRFGMPLVNMCDTSTAKHIINEQEPLKDLKSLSLMYAPELGAYNAEQEQRVKERGGWEFVTDEEMLDYAACDGIASMKAGVALSGEIDSNNVATPYRITMRAYDALAKMEHNGVHINRAVLDELDEQYTQELTRLRTEIHKELGPINVDSPTQLQNALLDNCVGIDLVKSKRVQWLDEEEQLSTQKMILRREAERFPVLNHVLDYRTLSKRHGTYITGMRDRLVRHPNKDGWFVHGRFRTDVVETFRLSSSEPNLQNIPRNFKVDKLSPEEIAKFQALNVKRMYTSRFEGGSILEVDQSQLELRIAAELSGDPTLIETFLAGGDVHSATALKVFGELTEDTRQRAKTINFLILYQGGPRKLAADLGISKDEAKAIIDQYFAAMPVLAKWIQSIKDAVKDDLFVENLFGYRRYFVEPYDWNTYLGFGVERQAVNTPIQGGAGVLVQVCVAQVVEEVRRRKLRTVPIITVHDSQVLDVFPGEEQEVAALVKHEFENPDIARYGVKLSVPLVADVAIGPSWAEKNTISF